MMTDGRGPAGVHGLMELGLLRAQRRALPKVATRSRLLSLSTILLVFAIVVTAIAGFAHVSLQQQSLISLREESQEMRAVHRALTQADADVLYFALGDRARLESYVANIGVLNNAAPEVLAWIDRLAVGEGEARGSAVINELKN